MRIYFSMKKSSFFKLALFRNTCFRVLFNSSGHFQFWIKALNSILKWRSLKNFDWEISLWTSQNDIHTMYSDVSIFLSDVDDASSRWCPTDPPCTCRSLSSTFVVFRFHATETLFFSILACGNSVSLVYRHIHTQTHTYVSGVRQPSMNSSDFCIKIVQSGCNRGNRVQRVKARVLKLIPDQPLSRFAERGRNRNARSFRRGCVDPFPPQRFGFVRDSRDYRTGHGKESNNGNAVFRTRIDLPSHRERLYECLVLYEWDFTHDNLSLIVTCFIIHLR